MKVLLDTNAYSAFVEGRRDVVFIVRQSDEILMSTIVIGELQYGFECGNKRTQNRDLLRRFLVKPTTAVLKVTETTADRYARIASDLRRKGRQIPVNDMWIAAHTVESGAVLVTYDQHFTDVDGLVWEQLEA